MCCAINISDCSPPEAEACVSECCEAKTACKLHDQYTLMTVNEIIHGKVRNTL